MNDELKSPPGEMDSAGGQHAKRGGSGPARALTAGWPVAGGGRPDNELRGQPPRRLALIPPPAYRGHVPSDGTGGESPSAAKRRKSKESAMEDILNGGTLSLF